VVGDRIFWLQYLDSATSNLYSLHLIFPGRRKNAFLLLSVVALPSLPEDRDNNFTEISSSWRRWAMSEAPVTSIKIHGSLKHVKLFVVFPLQSCR